MHRRLRAGRHVAAGQAAAGGAEPQQRAFETAGDVDYWKFAAFGGQTLRLRARHLSGGLLNDAVLTLYDRDGVTQLAWKRRRSGQPSGPDHRVDLPGDGDLLRKAALLNPSLGGCEFAYEALIDLVTPPTATPTATPTARLLKLYVRLRRASRVCDTVCPGARGPRRFDDPSLGKRTKRVWLRVQRGPPAVGTGDRV